MIVSGDNKSKLFFLWVLVLVFFGLVVYQWFQLKPFQHVAKSSGDNTWQQINGRLADSFRAIVSNFELARQQTEALPDELRQAQQREELIEKAREYLNNNHSTSSEEIKE